MPENKALKVLPPELPKEYREFVACTRDTLEVEPGKLTWAKLPGVPDSLKPTATFEPGEGGSVKVTISAAGLSLQVDISVTKHGNLKADTSSWPFDTPFVGDQLKDLANGIDRWIDDLNAEFRKNNKKVGSLSVVNGKLTGSKVALSPRTALADTFGGNATLASRPDPEPSPFLSGTPASRPMRIGPDEPIRVLSAGFPEDAMEDVGTTAQVAEEDDALIMATGFEASFEEDLVRLNAPRTAGLRAFPRPAAVGAGAGILITGISTALLMFGRNQPIGDVTYVLPPVGEPVTITGILATTDLDFEVLQDVSSELALTFPDNGGLVDGRAQVKYDARSSSGATFTNTSDLEAWAAFDWSDKTVYGYVRHHATGEAPGQPSQTRELSPLAIDLTVDSTSGAVSGAFQGVGFSYPASGAGATGLSEVAPGNMSLGGSFDASALDRTDATETVLENDWRLFLNDGNRISGVGVLRAKQIFDSAAFGAGCTFEAERVVSLSGTFDPGSGAVTGTSHVLAWGQKSDSCTFDTGVAAEDAAVTGNLTTSSGELALTINASATVAGPFEVNASFDPVLFGAPGQPGGDKTLPTAGVAIGIGLTLASIGLGLFARKPGRPAAGA